MSRHSVGYPSLKSQRPSSEKQEHVSSEASVSNCSSTTNSGTDSSASTIAHACIHHSLSTVQLLFIHIGAALTLFLATTDATIVSTSLPTIASDLQASSIQYTWVGVAYMLTQTAFQPLYGRVSDLVGRKSVLYSSIAVFAFGSALCGAAQSINWLISARAIAGIGGGGIVSSVWVITSEVVEIRQRATWSQALSVTWSCSAIAGPLIGGLFSGQSKGHIGWRWGFYINLPICFLAVVILSLSLRRVEFAKASNTSWQELTRRFDFIGLLLFMGGTSCIIIGFSFATEIGFGILLIAFAHNVAFTAGTFYLVLFYQAAHGSTPLQSGLKLLPYSLGSSLASMPVAWFINYWQGRTQDTSGQNLVITIGLAISTLGFGLLNLLNEHASIAFEIVYPLVAGVGIGMLFHAPYQVFLRALKPQELATGTSAFFLTRFTGATIGLAVAGTIFYARVSSALPPDLKFRDSSSSINYAAIKSLPSTQKEDVLHVISSAIRLIWTVCTPCLGIAFLISFKLRKIPSAEVTEIATAHTISGTQVSVENSNEKV
ncbi:putative MFS-type transporter [Psilocybe cubensis]|uniref:MFS-type transporter n=2 Tax=Psilocybe cubensis TaxID=181762 RepID=A0ACB8HHB5_PSICU|nr:putative MFS-type transporter [Psilocybe cubensis]KAH9487097.1 putative MFS-type transporter [Psilocybe cubensis]